MAPLLLLLLCPPLASSVRDRDVAALFPGQNASGAGSLHLGLVAHHEVDGKQQETLADVMKIKRNNPEDLTSLLTATCTSLMVVAGCVLTLRVLHEQHPGVYGSRAPSQEQRAERPVGLLGWLRALEQLPEEEVMRLAGLDALMLGEFHGLCASIFCTVGLAAFAFLAPLCFLTSRTGSAEYLASLDAGAMVGLGGGLARLKHELGLLDAEQLLAVNSWAHAIAVWLVVLHCLKRIEAAQHRFLRFRFLWLKSIRPPRSTTLMVEGIPECLSSDEALRAYYAKLFSSEAIDRAYIVRRTGDLKKLVAAAEGAEHRLAIAKAHEAAASCEGNQSLKAWARWALLDRVREPPAALEGKLAAAREAVRKECRRVEAAVERRDPSVCSRSGFVTFTTRRWCRLASREQLCESKAKLRMSMPPAPGDVRYGDLAQDAVRGTGLEWLGTMLKFALVCAWTPFVVTVTAMADVSVLRRHLPPVALLCSQFPGLEATLQGVVASLLLQALMGFLPQILFVIITNFQVLKSNSWAQLELQRSVWLFQVLFVLLVTAINQTVLGALQVLLVRPGLVFVLLAGNLPDSSHFYVNYLAVGCMSLALELLRLRMLLQYVVLRLAGATQAEARERAEGKVAQRVAEGMGVRMAKASFMATVGLVFCTTTPLITPFAFAYFSAGWRVFRYLAVFGESQRTDLGGAFWFAALQCLVLGLGLLVLLVVGILSSVGDRLAAGLAATALGALLMGWSRLKSLQGEVLPFEVLVSLECEEAGEKRPVPSGSEHHYRQPECCAGDA